jgi:hypothetical protein
VIVPGQAEPPTLWATVGEVPRLLIVFLTVILAGVGAMGWTLSRVKGYRRKWRFAPWAAPIPWLLLLANLFYVNLHHAPYMVPGERTAIATIWSGLVGLAILGVSVVSLTMAYVKRTPAWMISGLVGTFFLLIYAVVFVQGLTFGVEQLPREAPVAANSEVDLGEPTEPVRGRDVPFTILIPKGWTIAPGAKPDDAMSTLLLGRHIYGKILAETGAYGGNEVLFGLLKRQMEANGVQVQWPIPDSETVDGRTWAVCTFQATAAQTGFTLTYRAHFYAGPEGSFTCLFWTAPNLYDRSLPQMEKIFRTFKFPTKLAAPAPPKETVPEVVPAPPAPSAADGAEAPAPVGPPPTPALPPGPVS